MIILFIKNLVIIIHFYIMYNYLKVILKKIFLKKLKFKTFIIFTIKLIHEKQNLY